MTTKQIYQNAAVQETNRSIKGTKEPPIEEEKQIINAIVMKKYNEFLESLTDKNAEQETEMIEYFIATTGAKKDSLACVMFSFFLAGMNSGFDIATALETGTGSKG